MWVRVCASQRTHQALSDDSDLKYRRKGSWGDYITLAVIPGISLGLRLFLKSPANYSLSNIYAYIYTHTVTPHFKQSWIQSNAEFF